MEEGLQQRIGRNEAIFRKVNEALLSGHWPGEEEQLVAFRCECGRLGCSKLVELTPADYQRIRAHARRFLIACGHDIPGAETVVETSARYVVVEKREAAGELAEATDPRS